MTFSLRHRLFLAIVLLATTGCEASPGVSQPVTASPLSAPTVPLTPSGPPVALTETPASDDRAQAAASVVRVDRVANDEAKLFGTAGGDPAMNGLQTYIAFFVSPAEGWTIYRIGDVLDYTVLSASAGRVELDLHESTMDEATGAIGSRHRKVIVAWTPGAEGAPPAGVSVTPGR